MLSVRFARLRPSSGDTVTTRAIEMRAAVAAIAGLMAAIGTTINTTIGAAIGAGVVVRLVHWRTRISLL